MNPLGGIVGLLGLVLIVVGIKGTQNNLARALSGARPSQAPGGNPGTAYSGTAPLGTGPPTSLLPLTGVRGRLPGRNPPPAVAGPPETVDPSTGLPGLLHRGIR